MISVFSRKLLFAAAFCIMFFTLSVSVCHAEDTEMVSGIVVSSQGVVVLDTELGEILVKNASFAAKLAQMDGQLVTVEGIVTETKSGGLEVVVKSIVE